MADSLRRERLEELITSNPNVNGTGWINADRQGHYKTYRFEVRGVTYEIDWACSYSILKCGEMRIPFDDLTVKGTWPTGFRYNLQFYYRGHACCVIPVEE